MDSKQLLERPKSVAPTQQQITAAIIQQQNRVIAQQNLDKLNANLEKQRHQMQMQQQLDMAKSQKSHFDLPVMDPKLTEFLSRNIDSLEGTCFVLTFVSFFTNNCVKVYHRRIKIFLPYTMAPGLLEVVAYLAKTTNAVQVRKVDRRK